MGFALFGISAPVFWLGLMALFIFWYKLNLTAGTGYTPIAQSPEQWASHLILPWIVLALLYAAIYARMVRGNLLDAMGEDFIRTARAKGLSERRVIFRHGLRASLAPIVTMFGLDIALLVGGAVITESVFNLDGLGFMAVDSRLPAGPAGDARGRPRGNVRGRDDEPGRRHRLRVPRPARAVRMSSELLLEVKDLAVEFPTQDGIVHAVSGLHVLAAAAARRSASSASRARARASRTSRSSAC